MGTPCRVLVKTALGKAAASVARAGETASFEAREIQQVSSILVRAVGGRFRN